MKMIKSRNFFQKIIIIIIFLILCNFIFPIYSNAFGGGTLLNPVRELVLGLGDGAICVAQGFMLPGSPIAIDKKSVLEIMYEAALKNGAENDLLTNFYSGGAHVFSWMTEHIPGFSLLTGAGTEIAEWIQGGDNFDGNAYDQKVVPLIMLSPANIFSNAIPAFDVNFINPTVWYRGGEGRWYYYVNEKGHFQVGYNYIPADEPQDEQEKFKDNTAYQLRDTIATWYKALRNIAIVGLLSVLVYVAIRIIMSSTAGETAKYKSMLYDWLVAMCILFFMHYMMAFLLKAAEMATEMFTSDAVVSTLNNTENDQGIKVESDVFMNESRYNAEELEDNGSGDNDLKKFGYAIIYLVLIFYTFMFVWKYLKRFIYLAFLTMISPLVALTYPIDKIRDGNAQAFSMWFKEYVFNVLIQPVHLLIYTILVTSAKSFAETNLIYTIVAIGFLMEAEKLIKAMFGFNKVEGRISSAGAAITGGAMFGFASNLIKNGISKLPAGKDGEGSSKDSGNNGKVHFNDRQADSDTKLGKLQSFAGADGSAGANPIRRIGAANQRRTNGGRGANRAPTGRRGRVGNRSGNRAGNRARVNTTRALNARIPNSSSAPKLSRINGIKNVAGRYFNRKNFKSLGRRAGRIAAMGLGAATLGTIGLAAGLASENDQDILTYTGLGLGAGSLAGGKAFDLGKSAGAEVAEAREDYRKGKYGESYEDEILNPRLDEEWRRDRDVINHFRTKYGSDYKQRMDEAEELRHAGITDQDDIDTALNLSINNDDINLTNVIDIMKFSKDLSKTDLIKDEDKIRQSAANLVGNNPDQIEKIMRLLNQKYKLE